MAYIAYKLGDTVRIKNDIFRLYGCKGKIVKIDERFITVELRRLNKKLDESELVQYQYYPSDLRLVS